MSIGIPTTGGQINPTVVYADQFAGANWGAQVAAAIASLPTTGGIIYATNFSGSQVVTSTITIDRPVTLIIGGYSVSLQVFGGKASINITTSGKVNIIGAGSESGSAATTFSMNGSADTVANIICGGETEFQNISFSGNNNGQNRTDVGVDGAFNVRFFNCGWAGWQGNCVSSSSGTANVYFENCTISNIDAVGGIGSQFVFSSGGPYIVYVNNCEFTGGSGNPAVGVMFDLTGSSGTFNIKNSSLFSNLEAIKIPFGSGWALYANSSSINGGNGHPAIIAKGGFANITQCDMSSSKSDTVRISGTAAFISGCIVHISAATSSNVSGILIDGTDNACDGLIVCNNSVEFNAGDNPSGDIYGIRLKGQLGNEFVNNNVIGNIVFGSSKPQQVGIYVDNTSGAAAFESNNICFNQLIDVNRGIDRTDFSSNTGNFYYGNNGNGLLYGPVTAGGSPPSAGADKIIELVGNFTFATLPTSVVTGSLAYCSDATVTNPAAGGGTGALVVRQNNSWVPYILPAEATITATAQTANIATTTAYAVPSTGAGQYRIEFKIIITTTAGTSSTLPSLTFTWIDRDNNATQTAVFIPTGGSGNSLTTIMTGVLEIDAAASTNIQYSTSGYASNPANAMQYAFRAKIKNIT